MTNLSDFMLTLSHILSCKLGAHVTEADLVISMCYHAKANFSDFLLVTKFNEIGCVFRVIAHNTQ